MCMFSRGVESVSHTKIFARTSTGVRQYLVYSMNVRSKEELAMILPIPVPKGTPDDAVKFISLQEYSNFFTDMATGFPKPKAPASKGPPSRGESLSLPKPLAVVSVGSFEASFVPTIGDFSRLDERFRLPEATWNALPAYRSFGFAVFKLKTGEQRVHPMAFEFPRANPAKLFFPTVHIHDGKVHARAEFDHTLYCQAPGKSLSMSGWNESPRLAGQFIRAERAAGMVDPNDHCYERIMRGMLRNEDILV